MMKTPQDIQQWRRERRAELLAQRLAVSRNKRQSARAACTEYILECAASVHPACVGFYWPFRGEIVVLDVVDKLLADGIDAALPVVIEKNQPLEFWAWDSTMEMRPGIWNIPVPAVRSLRHPDMLLVPLVGFDTAGYRLGYGGGYYDRTLVQMTPKPRTIGVGYSLSQLQTVYPQAHDIPMDAIVTEDGLFWV